VRSLVPALRAASLKENAFRDDAGRKAHLAGPIAAALMANATELLAQPPQIEQVDLLAVKLPK
jgi:quinol monooxygenase YgiN